MPSENMQQPLLPMHEVSPQKSLPMQETRLLNFHEHYQRYKYHARKFHKVSFYIFCLIQIVWIVMSFSIKAVNDYNIFIDQFADNMDSVYKKTYLMQDPGYADLLDHLNSFNNDYTVICWLIWISHVGFWLILAYIVYFNRAFFKQYQKGVKQMLPIFFALLTTFVVRDCLLMSISDIVQTDLQQIQLLLLSQQDQFKNYDASFVTFIQTSLVLVQGLLKDFKILSILTYIQQLCDLTIVCMLTVLIIRVYWNSLKCIRSLQQIKDKRQYAVEQQIIQQPTASSHRHASQLSKFSEQKAFSSHAPSIFSHKNIIESHKQIFDHPNKQVLNLSFHSFRHIQNPDMGMLHHPHKSSSPEFLQKPGAMKKPKSMMNIRKAQRSGSCNYLQGSVQISQIDQIAEMAEKKRQDDHFQIQRKMLKMKKQISLNNNQKNLHHADQMGINQPNQKLPGQKVKRQHAAFQV